MWPGPPPGRVSPCFEPDPLFQPSLVLPPCSQIFIVLLTCIIGNFVTVVWSRFRFHRRNLRIGRRAAERRKKRLEAAQAAKQKKDAAKLEKIAKEKRRIESRTAKLRGGNLFGASGGCDNLAQMAEETVMPMPLRQRMHRHRPAPVGPRAC